jgi:hypothetical protein
VAKEDRSVEKATNNGDSASGGAAAEEEDGGDICAICQEALSESPSNQLPCSHVYHVTCVEKLRSYAIKQVCPTCRVDLPPGPEQMWEEAARRWVVLDRRYGQGERKPWRRIRNADDRRENAEVVRMLTEAAEQGHASAQCHLGVMYRFGMGVPESDALASSWRGPELGIPSKESPKFWGWDFFTLDSRVRLKIQFNSIQGPGGARSGFSLN